DNVIVRICADISGVNKRDGRAAYHRPNRPRVTHPYSQHQHQRVKPPLSTPCIPGRIRPA
ncbi:hypothetical protein C8R44DRAFT_673102, partial [Mycena epipterygia]